MRWERARKEEENLPSPVLAEHLSTLLLMIISILNTHCAFLRFNTFGILTK
jgi:hypothetical protein